LNNLLVQPSLALMTDNFTHNPYVMFPFGRAIKGAVKSYQHPQFAPEITLGIPLASSKQVITKFLADDEEESKPSISSLMRKQFDDADGDQE